MKFLSGSGLNATSNSGQLAAILAKILGGNTLAGANAGAAGGIRSANDINKLIEQILAMP